MAIGCLAIIASVGLRDFDQYLNGHVSRQLYHKKDAQVDPLETMEVNTKRAEESVEIEKGSLTN